MLFSVFPIEFFKLLEPFFFVGLVGLAPTFPPPMGATFLSPQPYVVLVAEEGFEPTRPKAVGYEPTEIPLLTFRNISICLVTLLSQEALPASARRQSCREEGCCTPILAPNEPCLDLDDFPICTSERT